MRARNLIAVCSLGVAFTAFGCGDDTTGADAGAAGTGASGTHAGTGGGSGSGAGGGAGTAADGGNMLSETSSIRVVNLVPDVTFDAWGPDASGKSVRLAQNLEYATASDYFDVPVNPLNMTPIFMLWKVGDAPPNDKMFSSLLDDTHERVRIEVLELDGPGQRATIILQPQTPIDKSPTSPLEYETLDETEINRGDATKLNLHVTYHLFGIGSGIVDSLALEGEACFHGGSTGVADVFSVPTGPHTLAVYDLQTASECSENDPLATLPIDGDAGDNLLITLYREGDTVKMFSAPIE